MYDNEHLAAVIAAAQALMDGNDALNLANVSLEEAKMEQEDTQARVEELETAYNALINPAPVRRVPRRV